MNAPPTRTTVRDIEGLRTDTVKLYTNPLLLMLVLAYTSNFMDRTIIGTLAQAIKLDLKITDGQLGLLQGFAFVVLYSVMGVPIARLTERHDRVTIMSVCLAAWSAMTMLCGTAHGFLQLLLYRVGVGVGEAGCNAPSHSMIADEFPASQRSRALGVYNMGGPIGTMLGAMSAGLIAQHYGWRAAFLIVGAPGFILAAIFRLTVKEPARVSAPAQGVHVPVKLRPLAKSLAFNPALRHLILGFTLTSFGTAGMGSFAQPYFIRAFGLSYAQIGLVFGFFGGTAAVLSLFISGRLADRAITRDPRWHAWLPALGVGIAIPFSISGYLVGQWQVALMLGMVSSLFVGWFIAPTLSAIHRIVGARQVAMAMALVLMFQNFFGLGGGPLFTGLVIDAISQHIFNAQLPGAFNIACPGGVAAVGSAAGVAEVCKATLIHATRYGILATAVVKAWAVLHFLLAAKHLRRELGPAHAV
jgi:MFS family permease